MGRKTGAAALALAAVLAVASGCGKAVETMALTGTTAAAETVSEAVTESVIESVGTAESVESIESVEQETEPEEERPERVKVKGIYVTGPMAGTSNMDALIDLVDRTELNALVIDVKNDEGRVVCEMDTPLVSEIGAVKRYVQDMPALVNKCKEKGIYLIARIVAFKDPFLAQARPEWSLHNEDGSVFYDKDGLAWVNPYEPQVWEYLLEVSRGAVELGFDEIQFDYVRFSTDSGMKTGGFRPSGGGKVQRGGDLRIRGICGRGAACHGGGGFCGCVRRGDRQRNRSADRRSGLSGIVHCSGCHQPYGLSLPLRPL